MISWGDKRNEITLSTTGPSGRLIYLVMVLTIHGSTTKYCERVKHNRLAAPETS